MPTQRPLRVCFVHPDLGLGGAEMLVVNAAVSLQNRGHDVQIYTAHHDTRRCFDETRDDGPLSPYVHVVGDWLPRSLFGRMHVFCAVVRMLWIAFYLAFCARERFDVFVCDLVSAVVPVLQLSGTPVLFYCHYPDKLLCVERSSFLKRFYRAPFDYLEEVTTGAADRILVNSNFTAGVFREAFPRLEGKCSVQVLYPAIDLGEFDRNLSTEQREAAAQNLPLTADVSAVMDHGIAFESDTDRPCVLLSVNRYERKKNLALAIEALASLGQPGMGSLEPSEAERVHLVLAGGYDERVQENVDCLEELRALARDLGVADRVAFVPSFTNDQRLLLMERSRCVLYTPDREHFGIVPIEAMYARRAVVAVASGGPLESIQHGETGFLQQSTPQSFAAAVAELVRDPTRAMSMGNKGRDHVARHFSLVAFGNALERHIVGLSGKATARKRTKAKRS